MNPLLVFFISLGVSYTLVNVIDMFFRLATESTLWALSHKARPTRKGKGH